MAAESESFFTDHFVRLTNRTPYPWQRKLFLGFIAASPQPWPDVVDLPTGAGKTSVLHVWLLALAWSIRVGTFGVPRRLAWIVNRRVVVDQITTELETLIKRIGESADLRDLLASVSVSGKALVASTLRGQLADNGHWSRDPSTPAVVVGTVDMIGSRLLFRGYRAGRYYRPIHAGLLGVDTLIVNDEAHLSPALACLLTSVRDREPAGKIPRKAFRVLLLSATPGWGDNRQRFEHDPAEDAADSPPFSAVFHAPKTLVLREVNSSNELDAAIWSLATESPATRTAIFIEQPEKAAKLAERLRKDKKPCALLTGTMRGYERDRLLTEDAVFRRFLDHAPDGNPVWLVCTSAGEVGINFSCERMITGLVEADHLLQRFGRLNRFGESISGEANVVFRNPLEKENKLRQTIAYLRGLDGDVSCAKVWTNRAPADACTDPPVLARLESRLVDLWAQTTYRDRFVPPVGSWLHGQHETEAPDAELAWRSDVAILTEWGIDAEQIRGVLEYYPVHAQEKLSEPASRIAGKLGDIAQRVGPASAADTKVILVESDGTPTVCDLAWLAKQKPDFLAYKLLLLPDRLGSVLAGMFQPAPSDDAAETLDVADPVIEEERLPSRTRFLFREGGSAERLPTKDAAVDLPAPSLESLAQYASNKYRLPLVIENPNPTDEDSFLVYYGGLPMRRDKLVDVGLSVHQASVAARGSALAGSVGLAELADTYEKVGAIHDSGKQRPVWQRAMGGTMENPIAKSKAPVNVRLIDGYRHELGSLLDAASQSGDSKDDLLLHLVASHHAAARPFFEARQYDRQNLKQSAYEAAETARRYARLQARYGAWGLAYLEALFKCADGMVSAAEGEPASA